MRCPAQLDRGEPALTSLAQEWRHLLFPTASDAEFADGYTQAVTFGLLLARAREIDLHGGIDTAAKNVAGICAHPSYTAAFASDLAAPGIRVPLTADRHLFRAVSELGKRVIWLHTYGQRLVDTGAERPRATPRLPKEHTPRVIARHPIPSNEEHMPDRLGYDPQVRCLHVGEGVIEHVTPRMWKYDVSGGQRPRQVVQLPPEDANSSDHGRAPRVAAP